MTSPTDSPRYGKIGLAIVPAAEASVGNTVQIATREGSVPAAVDALPIYDTLKKRPRA